MTRWLGVLVACALTVSAAAGCLVRSDSPDDVITAFADALSRGDVDDAAGHTTDPTAARAAIRSVRDGMGRNARLTASAQIVDDKKVTATIDHDWTIGTDRHLRYESTATVSQVDSAWRVDWRPTVLHPSLATGETLSYSDDMDYRTPYSTATDDR